MSDRPWTVGRVLNWMSQKLASLGIESARLDAELLVAHALGCDRLGVYLKHDRPLGDDERSRLRELIVRRSRGEPVAYLLGKREFYGLELQVDARVLVPRPETELLVDEALHRLQAPGAGAVVDVGTGSGAVALALAWERPPLRVLATDRDSGALAVARGNALRLGLAERVSFLRGDLTAPFKAHSLAMIVSNPPYVADADPELSPAVRRWEPGLALFGGADGLDLIRRLLSDGARTLMPGGWLLLEMGQGQGGRVEELASRASYASCELRDDLAGIPRVAILRRPF